MSDFSNPGGGEPPHDPHSMPACDERAAARTSQPQVATAAHVAPRSDDADEGPPPIQFRLTSFLAAMTVVGALFALISRVNAVWGAALVWLALLAGAHVAATVWGSTATARSSRRKAAESAHRTPVDAQSAVVPTTRLGDNHRLGVSLVVIVGIGAVVGAVVGTALVWTHRAGGLGPSATIIAGIASAVIGGFLCFLAGSCVQVSARAWHEATRHGVKPRRSNP